MRPSRKPFCRQCFSCYFEAHSDHFRTFPLISTIFGTKVSLSAKTGLSARKHFLRFGAPFGVIFASLRKCCSRQWFLWCFELHFHFFAFLEHIFRFLAPKRVFGAESAFWRENAKWVPKGVKMEKGSSKHQRNHCLEQGLRKGAEMSQKGAQNAKKLFCAQNHFCAQNRILSKK